MAMVMVSPSITQLTTTSTLCLTRRSIYFISPSSFRSPPSSITHQYSYPLSKQTRRPLNIISAANLPFDLAPPPIDHDLLVCLVSMQFCLLIDATFCTLYYLCFSNSPRERERRREGGNLGDQPSTFHTINRIIMRRLHH